MSGTKLDEAVEQLRCAEVNCDNIKHGPIFVEVVKRQIQNALTLLEADPVGGYWWQKEGPARDG